MAPALFQDDEPEFTCIKLIWTMPGQRRAVIKAEAGSRNIRVCDFFFLIFLARPCVLHRVVVLLKDHELLKATSTILRAQSSGVYKRYSNIKCIILQFSTDTNEPSVFISYY